MVHMGCATNASAPPPPYTERISSDLTDVEMRARDVLFTRRCRLEQMRVETEMDEKRLQQCSVLKERINELASRVDVLNAINNGLIAKNGALETSSRNQSDGMERERERSANLQKLLDEANSRLTTYADDVRRASTTIQRLFPAYVTDAERRDRIPFCVVCMSSGSWCDGNTQCNECRKRNQTCERRWCPRVLKLGENRFDFCKKYTCAYLHADQWRSKTHAVPGWNVQRGELPRPDMKEVSKTEESVDMSIWLKRLYRS